MFLKIDLQKLTVTRDSLCLRPGFCIHALFRNRRKGIVLLGCNSLDAVVQIEYMRKVLLANELLVVGGGGEDREMGGR